jgi:hypothetical protein
MSGFGCKAAPFGPSTDVYYAPFRPKYGRLLRLNPYLERILYWAPSPIH